MLGARAWEGLRRCWAQAGGGGEEVGWRMQGRGPTRPWRPGGCARLFTAHMCGAPGLTQASPLPSDLSCAWTHGLSCPEGSHLVPQTSSSPQRGPGRARALPASAPPLSTRESHWSLTSHSDERKSQRRGALAGSASEGGCYGPSHGGAAPRQAQADSRDREAPTHSPPRSWPLELRAGRQTEITAKAGSAGFDGRNRGNVARVAGGLPGRGGI